MGHAGQIGEKLRGPSNPAEILENLLWIVFFERLMERKVYLINLGGQRMKLSKGG